jgi:hypothetical protein
MSLAAWLFDLVNMPFPIQISSQEFEHEGLGLLVRIQTNDCAVCVSVCVLTYSLMCMRARVCVILLIAF